jgi:DNA-directed RNA polymerase specialized sigma24 family protein
MAIRPGPAEAIALVEDQLEELLHGLPELHTHLLEKRLQGFSVSEIAEHTTVSRQTVYRVLELLGERLMRQVSESQTRRVPFLCDKTARERH